MCKDCITQIVCNLNQEEILILQQLLKAKTNPLLTINKNTLIRSISVNISDYKFQIAKTRLELVNFIGTDSKRKGDKFYITNDGKEALKIFLELVNPK